ncbi:hypothetical protein [Streptomyces sp. NPDC056255]|uniref:hypothetical protein n=1 Tax=Streptomyces sp. NPDC056255 TaxID=3345764 RepID=UPI0035E099E0
MAAVRGSDTPETSQARVYAGNGKVVGAGFLVAEYVLCTCAHVVVRALSLGLTADRRVIAFRDKRLHFIDPEESANNLSMPVPPGLFHVEGHRPAVESRGLKQNFDLRPQGL